MSRKNSIDIDFDEKSQDYYVIWEPIIVGMGKTRHETLEDLRTAAHFGVDTFIDLKLKDTRTEKED